MAEEGEEFTYHPIEEKEEEKGPYVGPHFCSPNGRSPWDKFLRFSGEVSRLFEAVVGMEHHMIELRDKAGMVKKRMKCVILG